METKRINNYNGQSKAKLFKLPAKRNRISLPLKDGLLILKIKEIQYCKADGNYTRIITKKRTILISKTLKKLEKELRQHFFVRSHQSYLVNLKRIDQIGQHIIIGNTKLPISRARKAIVMSSLKNLLTAIN